MIHGAKFLLDINQLWTAKCCMDAQYMKYGSYSCTKMYDQHHRFDMLCIYTK